MNEKVQIVLATFNGDKYLSEQLDSLLGQTEISWTLLVRDDGSCDRTLELVSAYAEKDHRIRLQKSPHRPEASALSNFSQLLNSALANGAQYVFCCDQDDVWRPDKIERMMKRLRAIEGPEKSPSLVHHDLAVVDESLRIVAPSFAELMQIRPRNQREPQRLISRNEVTGCAMACNRALLEIALPVPQEAVMHDWWLALCAGFFGRLEFIPEPLVKYRQHGANAIGAKSFWHGLNPFTNWIAGWRRGDEEFISTVRQANAFLHSMGDRLEETSSAREILDLYSGLLVATRWKRLQVLRECGLWRSHWFLNTMLVLRMLLLPSAKDT